MKMPNGDRAIVPLPKLVDYLLSESHPVGRMKAAFFRTIGFERNAPAALHLALLDIARDGDLVMAEQSSYGTKYIVDGILTAPRGNVVYLRTVWIVEADRDLPRLVTAYPADRSAGE